MREPMRSDVVQAHINVRLPRNRLQCICGHEVTVHDVDVIEEKLVRAVCGRCHADLFRVEIEIW
jgi:hypothetical protein